MTHPDGSAHPDGDRFVVVATVMSPLRSLDDAPKQGDEGAPDAWITFAAPFAGAASHILAGDRIVILTWLDRARRDVLEVHPRDETNRPVTGVFSTRSPDRPNPVGLHPVEVLEVDGTRVKVRGLEALDGTPVIDVKPVLEEAGRR